MAIRRNVGLGLAVLATVSVLVGCARPAPPAATSASATSPTAAASASASDAAYVTALATRVLSWPDANATLRPLAQDTQSLVPASSAFAAISAGFMNVVATGAPRGQATASLYSYSNSGGRDSHPDLHERTRVGLPDSVEQVHRRVAGPPRRETVSSVPDPMRLLLPCGRPDGRLLDVLAGVQSQRAGSSGVNARR